ncbi:MAG TPA: FtsX-like permease family protein [Bryobacteraceae bacterium]|jgi:putative ABC transport system permease protein
MPNFWFTATRIAWRETRASAVKFAFVILGVAAGVGALSGVRGFSEGFRSTLLREARQIMAADMSVRIFGLPDAAQTKVIEDFKARGARVTQITETLTMANSTDHPVPLMVSIKAVDPKVYPFYGAVKTDPPAPLASLLDATHVGAADDVLVRLNVKRGDTIRIGGQDFQISTTIVSEPDRIAGSMNIGLRVMISREGLERTGLISQASRAAQRLLFKLPVQGLPVAEAKRELKAAFPDAVITDYRETNPTITRSLDRATTFLSLVSLIALIVGALGVATTMNSHLQQKLDGIAVMKSMGARSAQIIKIYLVQTMMLGLAGASLGLIFGALVQLAFPLLIRKFFPNIDPGVTWSWRALAEGLAAGILSTLLFTLPPLLRIRTIRPGLILRRDMIDASVPWWKRWTQSKAALGSAAAILFGMLGIAMTLSDPSVGILFVGGVVVSLIVLSGVAWLLLKSLRLFLRTTTLHLPSVVRHGIANIYRPGNQAQSILVALGIGVTFTVTVYLVQRTLISQLVNSAPPGMPNVFLIDITPNLKDGVVKLVEKQAGVKGRMEVTPAVAARLTQVNGVPLNELDLKGWARRFRQTRSVTFVPERPDGFDVYEGKWWKKDDPTPEVAVTEDAAKILNLKPGMTLDFIATGHPFEAKVVALYRTEGFRMGAMSEFLFTPKTLEGLPAIYYGGVRMDPAQVALLQRAAYEQYPTVTVINVADALALIQEVVDQAATVIRFLAIFSILAGVIILASSVAGTRFRRIREVVILKTIGGTRRRIASVFSIEFLLLGGVAGLIGALLGTALSAVMLRRVWEAEAKVAVTPVLVAILLTAVIANGAGWLASARILGQKPLEVLREE